MKQSIGWRDRKGIVLCGLCLILLLMQGRAAPVWAAAWSLPTQDGFVDPNNATMVYNGERLELTFSNFPSFAPTRRSLLQFDLASQERELTDAQLQLTVMENNINDNGTVVVALYGAADDWNESAVTWATRPLEMTLLQTITVTGGALGAITFDAATVGAYLEGERTGDQVASVYLLLRGGEGTLGFAGNLFFEDREGSADGMNGNEPTLVLSNAQPMERLYLPLIHNQ